jgi:formylglycine-generating enzyme required for sulfatase activity
LKTGVIALSERTAARCLLLVLAAMLVATGAMADDLPTCSNALGMSFVRIPAGTFTMGSGQDFNDAPAHEVTISRDFWLGVHEVTQDQFAEVMGFNPSWLAYQAGDRPVDSVTWFDAVRFCELLSEREGRTCRLPTEAEWEYACRAGTTTTWFFGDERDPLTEYAWTPDNCSVPMPVGQFKPNPWGLYDILGNVYEWVADWHGIEYYADSPSVDPTGPEASSNKLGTGGKVTRGGCWLGLVGMNCLRTDRYSSTARNCWTPYAQHRAIGFRVVMEVEGE